MFPLSSVFSPFSSEKTSNVGFNEESSPSSVLSSVAMTPVGKNTEIQRMRKTLKYSQKKAHRVSKHRKDSELRKVQNPDVFLNGFCMIDPFNLSCDEEISNFVQLALTHLHNSSGVSLNAIKKYLKTHFKVSRSDLGHEIRRVLDKKIVDGQLLRKDKNYYLKSLGDTGRANIVISTQSRDQSETYYSGNKALEGQGKARIKKRKIRDSPYGKAPVKRNAAIDFTPDRKKPKNNPSMHFSPFKALVWD